jgi:apolipoprotein N-acyltransferase
MLLAGALLVLTFPDANLEFLAWFGLVPGLVLIVRSPTAREGGIRAWWLGAGYLIAALYWMAPEIGPAVLLVAAVVGVLWVPFGVAAWKLLRPPVTWPRALAALVVVPSCWLLTEWLRSWQALGGPWAVYGVSQWQHPAVLALAAVGGVWLISIALVLANVAIVLVIGSLPRLGAVLRSDPAPTAGAIPAPGPGPATLRPGLALLGVIAGVASIGAGPLAFALTPASPAVRQVTIAMVQPGIVNNAVQRVDASERLTAELSRSGLLGGVGGFKPDLIVWGESSTAVDLTLAKNRAQLRAMEKLSSQDGADLLVNQDTTVPGRRVHPVPAAARLAHQDQQGRCGQHDPRPGRAPALPDGPDRHAAADRSADLLRVRVPRHVPGRHRQGRTADRLPVGDLHLPGHLGAGPARRARRGTRRRDRPAGGAGRADRRHRRLRRPGQAAGLDGTVRARRGHRQARAARGFGQDLLRPVR